MRKIKNIISILLAFMLLTSCTNGSKDIKKTYTYTDSTNREIEISKNINKVSPSGPLAEQVLISLVPEKMVTITQKNKNEEVEKILGNINELPESGQFFGKVPFNPETIAKENPDLIIDVGEKKKNMSESMDEITNKTGKAAVFIEMNLKDADKTYLELGKILGKEEKAQKLSDYIQKVNKELEDGLKKVKNKKTFIYLSGENGLKSNAKNSFQTQMLDMIGENVLVVDKEKPSSKGGVNEVSNEELLKLNPDIIIFGPGSIYDSVKDNPQFSELKAIKNNNYVEVPNIPYNWAGFPPSVNRYMGAQWLAKIMYPEIFKYNLEERTKEFYKLFYSYDLSTEEYNNITKNAFFKR